MVMRELLGFSGCGESRNVVRLSQHFDIPYHLRTPELVRVPLHTGHQVGGDLAFARHPKNTAARFAQQGCDLICIDKRFEICMHLLLPSRDSTMDGNGRENASWVGLGSVFDLPRLRAVIGPWREGDRNRRYSREHQVTRKMPDRELLPISSR